MHPDSERHKLFSRRAAIVTGGMADDDVTPVQPGQGLIRYAGVVKQQVVKLAEGDFVEVVLVTGIEIDELNTAAAKGFRLDIEGRAIVVCNTDNHMEKSFPLKETTPAALMVRALKSATRFSSSSMDFATVFFLNALSANPPLHRNSFEKGRPGQPEFVRGGAI